MKILSLTLALTMLCSTALASTFDVECMNDEGKFKNCDLGIEGSQVTVKQSGDKTVIQKNQITKLTMGDYTRRRVAEAVIFTPWLLFSKKKRDVIGIEYKEGDTGKTVIVQAKKKYGMPIKMQLESATGLKFEDGGKNTEWQEKAN